MPKSDQIKEYAKRSGADLVGIASMDRFEGVPKQMDPRYIFPEAKAMIVLGFRIPRGCFRGIEEGTYFANYCSFGYYHINLVHAMNVLRNVTLFLEDNGYEAVPYDNTSTRLGTGMGKPVGPDKPKPDVLVNFRLAGVAAGLGEIGHSKMFLSPEFGPRQRLALIMTDAPLDPDPLYDGQICDSCMMCVKECSGKAISQDRTVQVSVGGKQCAWGALDVERCRAIYVGGISEINPFMPHVLRRLCHYCLPSDRGSKMGLSYRLRKKVWYVLRDRMPYHRAAWASYHHPPPIEGARGCIRACMIHLEETGRIQSQFKNPFQKRKPWIIQE
jgi:hypothetical protein